MPTTRETILTALHARLSALPPPPSASTPDRALGYRRAMNGGAYAETLLAPALRPGDIVITDGAPASEAGGEGKGEAEAP